MTAPALRLSIVMPVRNEGIHMSIMLKILHAVIDVPHEVVVVYDDPTDTTVPVVTKLQGTFPNVRLVFNHLGRGVANAIHCGASAAVGDYILIFAVDEVGPVLAIADMIALADEGCDFVSCTRYAYGGRRLGGSLVGGILSRTANKMFWLLTKCPFTDATTGAKLIRREVFGTLRLTANPVGWAVAFELAIKAQLAGLQLGEVPIISIDRLYGGKSTFSLGPWLVEYFRWFVWGVKHLHRFSSAPDVKAKVRLAT